MLEARNKSRIFEANPRKRFLGTNLCCDQSTCGEVKGKEENKDTVNVLTGATEKVMAETTLEGVIDITQGPAFLRGVKYETASGDEIPKLGQRQFLGLTEEGGARGVTAQICAVNKNLMSVSKITAHGNRVIFDDEGSYIEDKETGEKTWMHRVQGMYMLEMWVSRKSTRETGF